MTKIIEFQKKIYQETTISVSDSYKRKNKFAQGEKDKWRRKEWIKLFLHLQKYEKT